MLMYRLTSTRRWAQGPEALGRSVIYIGRRVAQSPVGPDRPLCAAIVPGWLVCPLATLTGVERPERLTHALHGNGKRPFRYRPTSDVHRLAMMCLIVRVEASPRKQICGSMPENDSVNMSR